MLSSKQMGMLFGSILMSDAIKHEHEHALFFLLSKGWGDMTSDKAKDEFINEVVNAIMNTLVGDNKERTNIVESLCGMLKGTNSDALAGLKAENKEKCIDNKIMSDTISEIIPTISAFITEPCLNMLEKGGPKESPMVQDKEMVAFNMAKGRLY